VSVWRMCRPSLREKAQGVLGGGELPCFPRVNRGEDCCKHLRPHRLSTGAIGVQYGVGVIVDRGIIGPAAGQPREEGGMPTEAEGAVPVAGERWTFLGGWAAAGRRGIPWSATGHRGGDAARSWRGKAHGAPIGLAAAGRLTSCCMLRKPPSAGDPPLAQPAHQLDPALDHPEPTAT